MSNPFEADQLEELITLLLTDRKASTADLELQGLLAVATELHTFPAPEFKSRLKAELLEQAQTVAGPVRSRATSRVDQVTTSLPSPGTITNPEILPPLLCGGYGAYPVHRSSFVASAIAHSAVLALLVTVSIFAAHPHNVPRVSSSLVTDVSPYLLPPASDKAGGGGGGGDNDPLKASKGNPPRFARDQIAPPAIVVRNDKPKLPADPTVIGPPNLSFPQTGQMGDPLSAVLRPLSNGVGFNGGMGSGSYGGVGPGRGRGVGPGAGGGFGGGPYLVGGGVTRPRAIYDPEPEYSEEARKSKHQGMVVLQVVIGKDGRPQDIRVVRTLGMGLDERAIDAVRQWRFEPARKDGQAVAVLVNIEVNFRLY